MQTLQFLDQEQVRRLPSTSAASRASALLTIDLDAIAENYRFLQEQARSAICAAVVKADAYGLGAGEIAPALIRAGCQHFFVAHLEEGIALRRILGAGAAIAVLHGPLAGTEADFIIHDLVPVLNSLDQISRWAATAMPGGTRLPAILQVDTGMARFGLSEADVDVLIDNHQQLDALDLRLVMSHLACADEPDHPANAMQLALFQQMGRLLPCRRMSLAASSGIFLGPEYHFKLVRPGAALYGIAPQADRPNPMRPVVRLQGKVVQVRDVPANTPVGYGHTARTTSPSRLATVAVGYADGFVRSLSGRGGAWFNGSHLPILGRVSMDSIILDATALPAGSLLPGALVDLIDPGQDLDALARKAGTIGYELLTSLGSRYHRQYIHS
ncbi:alanine racemase [Microvirga sp. KLBC 81]|uniref:alanine racemase n=1 Tax=Microvirga sp. KLBC 81 TaxID=1862707 RepID=UPI000D51F387|nr:alanine racemase [Microvirga sp. KLBC 81]PVE23488.1 alanine racemase [Microvirga sp. KLBC 81]